MEANELRIGNYYIAPNEKDTVLDRELLAELIEFDWFHILEPIPLTDEWKTKLSFKQYPYEPENLNEGYYWSLQVIKGIYLTIEDGDDYAYLDYGLDFNGTKNLIKYQFVHEIQNVYNILKKEDITIK